MDTLHSLLNNCLEVEKSLTSNVKILESKANSMIDTTETFIQSFEELVINIRSTLTQQILEKNVKAKHAGDTPVRQSLRFPDKINKPAHREAIIQKFRIFPKMEEVSIFIKIFKISINVNS